MVGRKTSRSAGDERGVTFSGEASSDILTIRVHEQFTTPLSAVRSARRSRREGHGGCPRLTPRSCTDAALHREQGHPGGRTREEKRLNRFTFLVMRYPPVSPLFASWPWPRHHWMLVRSH